MLSWLIPKVSRLSFAGVGQTETVPVRGSMTAVRLISTQNRGHYSRQHYTVLKTRAAARWDPVKLKHIAPVYSAARIRRWITWDSALRFVARCFVFFFVCHSNAAISVHVGSNTQRTPLLSIPLSNIALQSSVGVSATIHFTPAGPLLRFLIIFLFFILKFRLHRSLCE